MENACSGATERINAMPSHKLYYRIKKYIPRGTQLFLRRQLVRRQMRRYGNVWPIDEAAQTIPANWRVWPEGKKFALVLTHDVDTAKGAENCIKLMMLELQLGFRSSFNFVPERYAVPPKLRHELVANGFEVGLHGLNHDGKLYHSREIFKARAQRINCYLEEWQAVGFRSPSMHHNLAWIHDLKIEYDASTFDTDPFEPQADGVRTIFPFWIQNGSPAEGYVELPYTLPQDFTLFVLMGRKNIDIWKKKLDWVVAKGGMVLLNVHPDYLNFGDKKCSQEEYPASYYRQFLEYVKERYDGEYWHVLPKELAKRFRPDFNEEFLNNLGTEVKDEVNYDRLPESWIMRGDEDTKKIYHQAVSHFGELSRRESEL